MFPKIGRDSFVVLYIIYFSPERAREIPGHDSPLRCEGVKYVLPPLGVALLPDELFEAIDEHTSKLVPEPGAADVFPRRLVQRKLFAVLHQAVAIALKFVIGAFASARVVEEYGASRSSSTASTAC